MIELTRINQSSLVVNSDLIEHIETTPDTVISLTNGQKFVVRESAAEVMDRVIAYQRAIRQTDHITMGGTGTPSDPENPQSEVANPAAPTGIEH